MSRMNRRSMLKFGGVAAAGLAGAVVLPRRSSADVLLGSARGPVGPETCVDVEIMELRRKPRSSAGATPPSSLYRALDTDFGVYGVQPQSWFDAARSEGYEGFLTTLHTYWDSTPQPWLGSHLALERALNAGMWVAAYGRPVSRWQEALTHLPYDLRTRLKFFALDIEVEPGGVQPVMRQEYADGVAGMGVRPIIYTGWGMWGDVMGRDNTQFSHLPLWDFSGDRMDWPATIVEEQIVEFGGWNGATTTRVGWQVQMQTAAILNGVNIDRDVFSRSFIDAG